MAGEDPQDPPEYETYQKVAVNGNIVGEIRVKPDALLSDIEDAAFTAILAAQFGDIAQDDEGEDDTEILKKYDPEIQIWPKDQDDDEQSWTSSRNLSETQFLDVYEDL
jgi:hypothetical protein